MEESIREGEEMRESILALPIRGEYDSGRLSELEKQLTQMQNTLATIVMVESNSISIEGYRHAMTQEVLELSQENSELKAKITQLEASSPSEVPSKKDVAFRLFVFLLVTFGSVAAQAAYAKSGVAIGDSMHGGFVIWARAPSQNVIAVVRVDWAVASDNEFKQVKQQGSVSTTLDVDWSVKVDVANLKPTKVYYYQFIVNGTASMIGRSKTLPRANDRALERVNLAVASCALLSYCYFNAYDAIADWAENNRLDAVLHLGDYIYEYSSSALLWDESDPGKGTRSHYPRKEIVMLQDYRERHSQWDSDRGTMRMRGALPLIAVWDDHEFTNNAFRTGAQNYNNGDNEDPALPWKLRAANASLEDRHRIYRQFQYGKLASLLMLHTRFTGRDPEQPSKPFNTSDMRYFNIVFAPAWRFTNGAINTDGWDGYAASLLLAHLPPCLAHPLLAHPLLLEAERERILDTIEQHAIDNVVVLTGDVHSSFAMDVPREQFKAYEPETGVGYDPATGRGSLALEIVCNAVGFDNLFRTQKRNVKYVQSLYKVRLKPTIITNLTIHSILNSVTEAAGAYLLHYCLIPCGAASQLGMTDMHPLTLTWP
ncbi:hypothetical protein QJQ45_001323 [Haematococcus lacustris]|nr:hypothetical protein QJQ45_001323 [Haematococcus lacustris]